MANTITSATAVYLLAVPGVFNTPVQLINFAVDEAFDTEAVDASETQVGVDGQGVAGWVPREYRQTISFLASSPSVLLFEQWMAAEDVISDVIYSTAVIRIPALSRQLTMSRGALRRYSPQSNVRRVLAMRQFDISWLPQPNIPAIVSSPL